MLEGRTTESKGETTSGDASPSQGGDETPIANSRKPSLTSISIPIHLPYIGRQWEPERVPLSSLDTLYSQAQLLNPVLLAMTRSYAANFNGVFPTKQSESSLDEWEFRAWPLGSSDLKARNFILGGVKSVTRCVAKKDMAYRGDASRLLDICRQVKTMKWIPSLPFPLLVSCHSPSSLLHFPHRDWARHSRHSIHPSTSHWWSILPCHTGGASFHVTLRTLVFALDGLNL